MITVNKLPVRTFNRLNMNETTLDYEPGDYMTYDLTGSGRIDLDRAGDVRVGITLGDNDRATVIMNCAHTGTLNVKTCIELGRSSHLTLIQVDGSPKSGRLINSVDGNADDGAGLHLIQLFPARGDVYSDCLMELRGKESSFKADIAYLGIRDQRLDLNYVVNHRGRKTESSIAADGVLKDNAFKLFKGTIDFKTGASGAKGSENEKVLLMGEDIVNQSIPLILCTEEDVEGSHGAGIGSIDDDTLLYLESRGMDEEEAKKLITFGIFLRLLGFVEDEALKTHVTGMIGEAI